jgi:hypothetical protein
MRVNSGRAYRSPARLALAGLAALALDGSGFASGALAQEAGAQGWTAREREWWSSVSQGSRLIPEAWFRALEQPGAAAPFLAPDHMRRFRYVPRAGVEEGRPSLPYGFAVDVQSDRLLLRSRLRWFAGQGLREPWVGLNCAACHTAELAYRGRRLRIEGAPTHADFQGFREAFVEALRRTHREPARFARFARSVLAGRDTAANRAMLAEALGALLRWHEALEAQNATPLRNGFGRLDAVGRILNKVALASGAAQTPWPADAPVSYPFLWNAPQHDKVQWNGVARNSAGARGNVGRKTDFGALARNTGQGIGVFGDVRFDGGVLQIAYSSLRIDNLVAMEKLVARLQSPAWPAEILGRPDAIKVARGAAIYAGKCASCHRPLRRGDLATPVTARMVPLSQVLTDIWMACNTYQFRAKSGALTGRLAGGIRIKPEESGLRLLRASISGVIIGKAPKVAEALAPNFLGLPRVDAPALDAYLAAPPPAGPIADSVALAADPARRARAAQCRDEERKLSAAAAAAPAAARDHLLAYKARPLNGIWATAPYLHNGSVPTLYDLLLPLRLRPLFAAPGFVPRPGPHRPERFFAGAAEIDPVKVGIATARSAENTFEFRVADERGNEILGNSNAGHDYGTDLSEFDRWALVEYMKTL